MVAAMVWLPQMPGPVAYHLFRSCPENGCRGTTPDGPRARAVTQIGDSWNVRVPVRRHLPVVTEVRAIVMVTEQLTACYFPGLKILFRSDVNDLDDLTASITRLIDTYNDLVDFIDAEQTSICFGPKLGARIEKMDPHALDAGVEERAAALFGTLVALARAETLSSIGEGEKAFGILGSLLRGETATSGAPAS